MGGDADAAAARERVIEVRGLRTQFGDHVVHDALDLDVWRGETLGVVGASGTGKSVLLRAIVGLKRPAAGRIRVLGQEVAEEDAAAALSGRIGVMFQDGALFSSLTVRENVEVPLAALRGLAPQTREALARLRISLAGLPWSAGDKFPSELSGGMRKRAGLARALALDPEILFLDEPTAGLDPIGASGIDTLLRSLSRDLGLTIFLVTHDLDTLYAACDRIAVLAERRVLATGAPGEMLGIDHPWVQAYFGGPRGRAARGEIAPRAAGQ